MKRARSAPAPFERAIRIHELLLAGGQVSAPEIQRRLGVSRATAKRDMLNTERALPVTRTRGVLRLAMTDRREESGRA